jgi:hypothetical protein
MVRKELPQTLKAFRVNRRLQIYDYGEQLVIE